MRFDSQEEQIEYYLGKDKFVNFYFNAKELPAAYLINDQNRNYEQLINSDVSLTYNFGLSDESSHITHFNNLGFRDTLDYTVQNLKDFENIILCIGCSDVFNPNLPDELIWPVLLQKQLTNTKVLNLGGFNFAPDSISRILYHFIVALDNVKHACIIWPPASRREFVVKHKQTLLTQMVHYEHFPSDDYWNFIDTHSNSYNFHKNKLFCEMTCKAHNVKLTDLYINKGDSRFNFDTASRFNAFGPKSNIALSKYFLKKITQDDNVK